MSTMTSVTMANRVLRSQILKPSFLRTSVCYLNGIFLQQKRFLSLSLKRYSIMEFKISERSQEKLKRMDNISNDFELIYKAPMELLLKVAYPIVGLCTIIPPITLARQYYNEGKISMAHTEEFIPEVHFINPFLEISIFGAALALLALGTYGIIFKYAFRVYKHKEREEYIALFLSYIPFMLRKFRFQSGTHVEFKNPFYSFMMKGCHFHLDGKATFLIMQYFRTPMDLFKMLGEN